jgi:hypothetical protein
MLIFEYESQENTPIRVLFLLIVRHGENLRDWKFQYDEPQYSMIWTPTFSKNLWIRHPNVTATLHEVEKSITYCAVTMLNFGDRDPLGAFKKVNDKTYKRLFLNAFE